MRRNSLFTRLFLILSGLAILPFFLIVGLSDSALLSTFQEDASRIGLGRLDGVVAMGDILTESVRSVCLGVAVASPVNKLEKWPHLGALRAEPDALFQLWAFQNELADRVRANDLIQAVVVRPLNDDYLIDSNRGTLSAETGSPPVPGPLNHGAGWSPDNLLTYVFPLSLFVTKTRGSVEAIVDVDRLGRWINTRPDDGRVFLLSPLGKVLAAADRSAVGTQKSLPDNSNSLKRGARVVDGASGKVLEAWVFPDEGPWVYYGEFPLQALNRGLNDRRVWILAVSVALAIVALVIAFLASRGFLRPMAELVTTVRTRRTDSSDFGTDEIDYLTRTFLRLQGTRRREVEAWILTGLEGNPSLAVPEEFPNPQFRCALVQIDRFRDFRLCHTVEEQAAWAGIWLEEICRTWATEATPCRGVVLGEGRMAIVLNGEGVEEEVLLAQSRELSGKAFADQGYSLSFCWGYPYSGVPGLVQSWQEAQALQEVRFLKGPGIYRPEDLQTEDGDRPLSAESIHRLLIALESGRKTAVEDALHRITEQIRDYSRAGQGQARLSLFQVAAAILSWMSENALVANQVFGPDFHLHRDLSAQETLARAEEWLLLVCQRLIETTSEGPDQGGAGQVGRVLAYLREHYQEDCDINQVAQAVGLSYSHVRKIFSHEVGDSISLYLNRLRIEDAKHLLKHTDLPLQEIATRVGYRNTQSLQRFFKKLGGTTAGAFREKVLQARAAGEGQKPQ